MHLAYVSTHDPQNPSLWAGTTFHIAKSLEAQGIKLTYIGPLREHGRVWLKAQQVVYSKLFQSALHRDREPVVLDGYARQVRDRITELERGRGEKIDAVFSPGTIAIAHLAIDKPIVFWTDATYAGIVAEYVWELPPSPRSRRLGDEQERNAISRSALAVYSSDWAARSAIEYYGADPARVKVVPFGANIGVETNRSEQDVHRMIDSRPRDRCRLLFVGVGWERKGGDVAVEVARLCNDRGLPTELLMLGSNPPDTTRLPDFVKPIGFVDKKTPAGRERFDELFGSSHFLLLPARAEAFGVVLCEANSYGVPNLATRVGGIPTIVRDGTNGVLFPPDDSVSMADTIVDLMRDRARYRELAESSFAEYRKRLNWSVAGATVKALVQNVLNGA